MNESMGIVSFEMKIQYENERAENEYMISIYCTLLKWTQIG